MHRGPQKSRLEAGITVADDGGARERYVEVRWADTLECRRTRASVV
ncbi:hypothetical protein [Natrinema sp. 74]